MSFSPSFSTRPVAQKVPFRHHKPQLLDPADFTAVIGDKDPAERAQAAHLSAKILVETSRTTEDEQVRKRILALSKEQGIELLAQLWSHAAPSSLPGALWRLYVLHNALTKYPEQVARYYREGKPLADVSSVVAGVIDPPGPQEVTTVSHEILNGLFADDLDAALDRAAAFCVVIAQGQASTGERLEHDEPARASQLYEQAQRLRKTAKELAEAARAWRRGELD